MALITEGIVAVLPTSIIFNANANP